MSRAGAIPVARTNLPDFALRFHTDNALHGADAGTSIHLNVTLPESEAHRLGRQHRLIEESLRRLTALAEAAS